MWTVDHDPDDVDDFEEALACAWDENYDGDTAKYESRVEMLDNFAKDFGFSQSVAPGNRSGSTNSNRCGPPSVRSRGG